MKFNKPNGTSEEEARGKEERWSLLIYRTWLLCALFSFSLALFAPTIIETAWRFLEYPGTYTSSKGDVKKKKPKRVEKPKPPKPNNTSNIARRMITSA